MVGRKMTDRTVWRISRNAQHDKVLNPVGKVATDGRLETRDNHGDVVLFHAQILQTKQAGI